MSQKYLIDTNVVIRSFYPQNKEYRVIDGILKRERKIYLSVVSIAEVLVGVVDDDEREKFEALLEISVIVPVDENVARLAADIRSNSKKVKKGFLLDCLLAATAIEHDLTLVSNDNDFRNIKSLRFMGVGKFLDGR